MPASHMDVRWSRPSASSTTTGCSHPACPPALPQKKKPLISDFWYDVAGWACLVGLAMGLVALQKNAPVAAAAK